MWLGLWTLTSIALLTAPGLGPVARAEPRAKPAKKSAARPSPRPTPSPTGSLATSVPLEPTPATAVGPANPAEATLLFDDARMLITEGDLTRAIPKLERVLARHPGSASYTEAHRWLAIAYLRRGDADRAAPLLRTYIEAKGRTEDGLRGRLLLSRIELARNRVSEAIAASREVDTAIERLSKQGSQLPKDLVDEAGLIRARAWIARARLPDATRSLEAVRASLAAQGVAASPPLRAEASALGIAIALKNCDRYGWSGDAARTWDEGELREILERRSICVSESLASFRDLLTSGAELSDQSSLQEGADALKSAYSSLASSCKNPPAPPPTLQGKKRTEAQARAYAAERLKYLDQVCEREFAKHLSLLAVLREAIPQKSHSRLDEVREHAQSLR